MLKKLFLFFLISILLVAVIVSGIILWGYNYYSRDLPSFAGINNYQPDAVSQIFSSNRELVAEVYNERRYPIKLARVPVHVRQAFLASEDVDFYSHPGIDPISILRALIKNIQQGNNSQGGSTITQQVVKNLLLTREKKLERKIKEAILAFKIESSLTKDQILELYLNQIFFGNSAYGIQSAAKLYYRKDVSELSIAEAAVLAGLPKAPSKYSPILNPKAAQRRQHYVIAQMQKAGFISKREAKSSKEEKLIFYPAIRNTRYTAHYYVSETLRIFNYRWKDYDIRKDGLKIYTALDLDAQNKADKALRKGLRVVDQGRGWRGPIKKYEKDLRIQFLKDFSYLIKKNLEKDEVYPALVLKKEGSKLTLDLGYYLGSLNLKNYKWARKFLNKNDRVSWGTKPESKIGIGDVIEIALNEDIDFSKIKKINIKKELPEYMLSDIRLNQTPEIEGAFVLVNPFNGHVLLTSGGYDYRKSEFNRVTQSLRQPGSAFKPFLYLTAIDSFGYTASSMVNDSPRSFRVGTSYWSPKNFDGKYLGLIPLRRALELSRNLVSADLISRIGVDTVIRYAKRMGIKSKLGRNLSLSLGSSEVTLLELTRAYGVFPAGGIFRDSVFITRIEDRNGNEIYNYKSEVVKNSSRVVNKKSAFIMAHLMKGVVERGTAFRVRELGKPAAGKTGTSNDQMDAWFIGYTPEWVAGTWIGFDQKKEIGKRGTGGTIAAPVWLDFMTNFLKDRENLGREELLEQLKEEASFLDINYIEPEKPAVADFVAPPGLETHWIYRGSGQEAEGKSDGAILEYYIPGTYKVNYGTGEGGDINYWQNDEF